MSMAWPFLLSVYFHIFSCPALDRFGLVLIASSSLNSVLIGFANLRILPVFKHAQQISRHADQDRKEITVLSESVKHDNFQPRKNIHRLPCERQP